MQPVRGDLQMRYLVQYKVAGERLEAMHDSFTQAIMFLLSARLDPDSDAVLTPVTPRIRP